MIELFLRCDYTIIIHIVGKTCTDFDFFTGADQFQVRKIFNMSIRNDGETDKRTVNLYETKTPCRLEPVLMG